MNFLHVIPPVIAHRGASAYAPENTMAAFTQAILLGVNWIEFDVMLSEDGEVIVFHDETLERITNQFGAVIDSPFACLAMLDAGAWFSPRFAGERIPLLRDVLLLAQQFQISLNIELKPQIGQEERLVLQVIKEINQFTRRGSLQNITILFSSFSIDALCFLRQYSPKSQMGLLLRQWDEHWQEHCHALDCISVHIDHTQVDREAVKKVKMMELALLCYTVDHVSRAGELFSFGVDAVFSNAPDKIMAAIHVMG